MNAKEVVVPIEIARAVFDIATNSMDFGSGFLDDEEVVQLRSFAERIGVDPMKGTPGNFKTNFQHAFVPRKLNPSEWQLANHAEYWAEEALRCAECGRVAEQEPHTSSK